MAVNSTVGHVPRKDSDTGRFITTEPAITRVAKLASAAIAVARADVGRGGRDGTATGATPHGEGSAAGLHAFEGAVASDSAAASRGGPGFPGTVDRAHSGAGGVCGGVGVGPRQDARCHERSGAGLG